MTSAWDLLNEGDLFGMLLQLFIDLFGPNGAFVFYGGVYFLGLGLIYIRTKDPMAVTIMFMLTSVVMVVAVPPNIQIYFVLLLITSIALVIYQLYRDR